MRWILIWSIFPALVLALDDLPTGFFQNIDGISIALSTTHLCSIEAKIGVEMGGTAACWGFDHKDILYVPKNEIFVQIVVARGFACGIKLNQQVMCWGEDASQVSGLYTQITASDHFACGVLVDGNLNCWGVYKFQLPPAGSKFVQISCSSTHCCTLDYKGIVSCWRWKTTGPEIEINPPLAQLLTDANGVKYLRTQRENTPKVSSTYDLDEDEEEEQQEEQEQESSQVSRKMTDASSPFIPIQFKQISVGSLYSCGIQYIDSKIRCWGNIKKALNGKDLIDSDAPYRQVSVGEHAVCMISETTNEASCIGITSPSQHRRLQEQGLELVEWDQLKVGNRHVCGVTMDSELICSGPKHISTHSHQPDFVVA